MAPAVSARRLVKRHRRRFALAGLPGIPILQGDRPFHRHLDIGIVEDDERRVAAQFHRAGVSELSKRH